MTDDPAPPLPVWTGIRRSVGLVAAGVCLLLATAGMFLPLLPSTPFVLLAAFLLTRCSERLHQRLLESRLFGGLLRDWQKRKGIRLRDKLKAIGVVLVCAAASLFVTRPPTSIVATALVLVGIGITVIASLPSAKDS